MTAVSKNVHIYRLDDIIDKCDNKYYTAIKIKSTDVKTSTCIDFDVENNDKDPKFKVGDHVRISTYKNIFAKVHTLD